MDPSQLTEFLVFITIKDGCEDAFIPSARANRAGTLGEPGNLRFDMYRNVDNAREFLFAEKYASIEAVTAHRQTPHFLDFFKTLELVQEFPRRREPGNSVPENYSPLSDA